MQNRSRRNSQIETLEKMVLMSASLIDGSADAELIEGTNSDNFINGLGGDDRIHSGLGTNFVDGGDGIDTLLVPEGDLVDFRVDRLPDGTFHVQSAGTGADVDVTLVNVEQIEFRDSLVKLNPLPPSENSTDDAPALLSSNDAFLLRVVELTNGVRRDNGLQELTINNTLQSTAQLQSTNMAEQDFFSHTGKDGLKAWHRAENLGYNYQAIGENIAAGQLTPEAVVDGWVNSPGHLANILNPQYTEIGVGYQFLQNDAGVVNYHHYWTQVFGNELPTVGEDLNSDAAADEQPFEVVAAVEESTPEAVPVQPPIVDPQPEPVDVQSEPIEVEPPVSNNEPETDLEPETPAAPDNEIKPEPEPVDSPPQLIEVEAPVNNNEPLKDPDTTTQPANTISESGPERPVETPQPAAPTAPPAGITPEPIEAPLTPTDPEPPAAEDQLTPPETQPSVELTAPTDVQPLPLKPAAPAEQTAPKNTAQPNATPEPVDQKLEDKPEAPAAVSVLPKPAENQQPVATKPAGPKFDTAKVLTEQQADRVLDTIRELTRKILPAINSPVPQNSAKDQISAVQFFSAETAQANPFENTNPQQHFGLNREAAARFADKWLQESSGNSVLSVLGQKKDDNDNCSRPLINDEFHLVDDNRL